METPRFFFLLSLSLFLSVFAQDRAPHGLANQKPTALSPSAYEFFHPNDHKDPCATSNCSPLPLAAQVHETQSQGERQGKTNVHEVGAGVIVAPAFGLIFMLCLAMGIYYLATTRRVKLNCTKTVEPDV
ncbi:hypothetical protein RND81_11G095900 [Saponaria officinalis]|uniref:Transmembrane protein n=1 Tax=Saponaria officinalis TaxID=3572 RepID=A0AAW1HKH4_SAPOF